MPKRRLYVCVDEGERFNLTQRRLDAYVLFGKMIVMIFKNLLSNLYTNIFEFGIGD